MAQLEARIDSNVGPTLRRSKVVLGMSNARQQFDFAFEEDDLFVLDVNRIGDPLGFTAELGDQVDVYDTEQSPDELLFSGLVVARSKPFIQQTIAPFQVDITVMDWGWRMAFPPTWLTKAYQSPTQIASEILDDALQEMELDDLGYTTSVLDPPGEVVPPIVWENANMVTVANDIAELLGMKWVIGPDKIITMKPQAFYPVAPFRVTETGS